MSLKWNLLDDAVAQFKEFQSQLSVEKLKSRPFFPPSIRSPQGGHMDCGESCENTLRLLVPELICTQNWRRKVRENHVFEELLNTFGEVIFNADEISWTSESFVSAVISNIEAKLTRHTVIIPCHLSYSEKAEEYLELLNVELFNKYYFKKHIATKENVENKENDYYKQLMSNALEHYKKFGWFISVKTESVYDSDMAVELAEYVAKSLVNLFKLIIPSSHNDKISSGFDLTAEFKEYTLLSSGSNLSFTYSSSSEANVGLPDPLLSLFDNPETQKLLDIISVSINGYLELHNEYPVISRVLDALGWLGDAVSEKSYTSMIVKYITALERLLLFGEESGLKVIISKRSATLLVMHNMISINDFEKYQQTIGKAYKMRSEILHGQISPSAISFEIPIYEISEIVSKVIISFMYSVEPGLELRDDSTMQDWLKSKVIWIEKEYKAVEV